MSKNIEILEGSTAKQFGSVNKIRINEIGGGSTYWVPEDETRLTTKYISENGVYRAADDGYYGYSQVTVNGIGKTTGTAHEGDSIGGVDLIEGEKYVVEENPETGEFVVKILPSAIGFALLPSKLSYLDGETIKLNGAVVRAYLNSGGDWEDANHPNGIIPLTELTLDPATADKSGISAEGRESDLDTRPHTQPLPVNSRLNVDSGSLWRYETTCKNIFAYWNSEVGKLWIGVVFASDNSDDVAHQITYEHDYIRGEQDIELNGSYTQDGKTVYYYATGTYNYVYADRGSVTSGVLSSDIGIPRKPEQVAWTLVYGESVGGTEEVTVKWKHPDDEKELTTTFEIHVSSNDDQEE